MTKRWTGTADEEVPEVDAFLGDIMAVCKKHNMMISHEDTHGGFVIHTGMDDYLEQWLRQAMYYKPDPSKNT